jgi:hypothetical protein
MASNSSWKPSGASSGAWKLTFTVGPMRSRCGARRRAEALGYLYEGQHRVPSGCGYPAGFVVLAGGFSLPAW